MPGLRLLVHADSKVGKSWLADTAPGPRLILDAEGGTDWTPSHKVKWDPRTPPPEVGPDDSVVVRVLQFSDLQMAQQWLVAGKHPFRSVVVDSVTEAQYKCQQAITKSAMQIQDWGALLRDMLDVCTTLRDLTDHATNPVECVVFITGSKPNKDSSKIVPDLQGQLERKLPYIVDVVGYLFTQFDPTTQLLRRGLLIQPTGAPLAGDRTNALSKYYGTTVPDPTLPDMLEVLHNARR